MNEKRLREIIRDEIRESSKSKILDVLMEWEEVKAQATSPFATPRRIKQHIESGRPLPRNPNPLAEFIAGLPTEPGSVIRSLSPAGGFTAIRSWLPRDLLWYGHGNAEPSSPEELYQQFRNGYVVLGPIPGSEHIPGVPA
jgi:hypothetical protein